MTPTDRALRDRLLAAEVRLALADRADIRPSARPDIARRLIELGAEVRPDGTVRLAAGGGLQEGLDLVRADGEHLFVDTAAAPTAKAKPDLNGLTAAQKLEHANGGAQ